MALVSPQNTAIKVGDIVECTCCGGNPTGGEVFAIHDEMIELTKANSDGSHVRVYTDRLKVIRRKSLKIKWL